MKFTGGLSWFIVLIAFLIFAFGAGLSIDRDGFSLHHEHLVVELGLAVYMLAILAGGVVFPPSSA